MTRRVNSGRPPPPRGRGRAKREPFQIFCSPWENVGPDPTSQRKIGLDRPVPAMVDYPPTVVQTALRLGWIVYVWIAPGSSPDLRRVVYVGCSSNWGRPFRSEHKVWDVDEIWIREFKTSWMARAAEKLFIRVLRPALNTPRSIRGPNRSTSRSGVGSS